MIENRKEYYKDELAKVAELQRQGDGAAAVREAGRLFEELLRGTTQTYLSRVPYAVRKAIFDTESKIGKGNKGVAEFQFGELVGIWRTCRLADAIEQVEGRSTRALVAVDLNLICDLRNDCVHNSATPEEHEVEYVVAALRTFLGFFGVSVADQSVRSPRSVADFSELMRERFSSVEVIEGTVAFYRRLMEIVSRPEVDTYDLTYLVEDPPKPAKARATRDPTREYFEIIRRRVLAGEARLRRIVTFNNPAKSAWILFNLVGSHREVFEDNMTLATFEATRGSGTSDILVPNIAMYYTSQDVTDGVAWVYSHQADDHQNFIGLSGKALFPTMRRLYANWFKSCDRLTEARAVSQFSRFFGHLRGEPNVRAVAEKYRDVILLEPEEFERSIKHWVGLMDRYVAEERDEHRDRAARSNSAARPSSGKPPQE
ncbi:MAG: hypothetical protein HYY06_33450 [Deltaproteobacteria bacterium]|nr:hypothetical protein [Deltaproteobacteria bacterium]